jgi:hypothetical protein
LSNPEAALTDTDDAVRYAREIGQAATLMFALMNASFPVAQCGNYAAAKAVVDELVALANEKASKQSGRFSLSVSVIVVDHGRRPH